MSEPTFRNCEDCGAWRREICVRHAPAIQWLVRSGAYVEDRSGWPQTLNREGCYESVPKPEPTNQEETKS